MERIVYESDDATVYLVEHIFMQTRRIIKKILKKSIHHNSFYSETNILKTIKHPNIPIIYDQYEDECAFYIVEEYIEAQNLFDYIRDNGVLSESLAIDIGIKLCEIISFLHSQKPTPILFLDIQPKNILIKKEKIYLVDFGNSYFVDEANNRELLLGTKGYAAPEQYKYENLDERTDIYGIGAILYFMVTGKNSAHKGAMSLEFPNEITGKYKTIVKQCMSKDREYRFLDVSTIVNNLKDLTNADIKYSVGNKPLTISLVGTGPHCGVTTIGLGLANTIAKNKEKVIYEECNSSNHVRNIAAYYKLEYVGGYFKKNDNLLLKPEYGPQILLEKPCQYIIRDHGHLMKWEQAGDVLIIICEVKPWRLWETADICKDIIENCNEKCCGRPLVLTNSLQEKECMNLWKALGIVGYGVPHICDAFNVDKLTEDKFKELINSFTNTVQGGEKNKKKGRLFKRISKKP